MSELNYYLQINEQLMRLKIEAIELYKCRINKKNSTARDKKCVYSIEQYLVGFATELICGQSSNQKCSCFEIYAYLMG